MKKLLFFCGVAAVLCSSCGKRIARVESVDIVPQPVSVVASDGAFDLTKNTKICLLSDDSTLNYSVRLFNGLIDKSFGKPLPVIKSTQPEAGAINVRLGGLQPEEYTLNIRPDGVDITGGSPAGVFYAFQTLRQLLPVAVARGEKAGVIELPVAEIADKPHFAHRGGMLDVAPDRRPGLADRNQTIPQTDRSRRVPRPLQPASRSRRTERFGSLRRFLHAGRNPRHRTICRKTVHHGHPRNRNAGARLRCARILSLPRLQG